MDSYNLTVLRLAALAGTRCVINLNSRAVCVDSCRTSNVVNPEHDVTTHRNSYLLLTLSGRVPDRSGAEK